MKKSGSISIGGWCLVVMILLMEVKDVNAVNCSVMELSSCLGAVTGGGQPSSQCCGKVREQQPCFCGYIRNPSLRPYVNSPNVKRVASTCGVTIPRC